MLINLYIEALLIDEELADLVWELWNVGAITEDAAWIDSCKRRGRKATGPRFLREAMDDSPKDPRSPGCRAG